MAIRWPAASLAPAGVSALVSAFLVDRSHIDRPPEIPRAIDCGDDVNNG